jgi:hypothetical protein
MENGQGLLFGAPAMKHYRIICADPPWAERGGGKCKRGADRHYPLMSTRAISRRGKGTRVRAFPSVNEVPVSCRKRS